MMDIIKYDGQTGTSWGLNIYNRTLFGRYYPIVKTLKLYNKYTQKIKHKKKMWAFCHSKTTNVLYAANIAKSDQKTEPTVVLTNMAIYNCTQLK